MAAAMLFYYIGDDETYFKGLQAEFAKTARIPVTFKRLFETEESKIQSLYIKLHQSNPSCVFIDFSKCTQDYLHLARLLTRTRFSSPVFIVGLLDQLTPPEVQAESLATGIHLTHFKGPEIFDVVFDVTRFLAPEQLKEHGFATGDCKETWDAGVLCKIGYVHEDGLHFETDFPLKEGQTIELNHSWREKKIIPSRQVVVKKVSESNLFYQFKYAVDAEFNFVDVIIPAEDTTPEDLESREVDRKDKIRRHRKLFAAWIEDNASSSLEKIAKVLIVDPEFHFLQDQKRTDKYPYVIRCVSTIDDIKGELDRVCPQVIAVSLGDAKAKSSVDFAFLERLVAEIKKGPKEDWPFLVVFHTQTNSKDLQNQLTYPQVMAASNELSVEVLLRMAAVFDKKLHEARKMKMAPAEGQRVYIRKANAASVADFKVTIEVIRLSETDLSFTSAIPFEKGTNLRILAPVPFVISADPVKATGKVPEYYGLIHCLSEVQKKELRRYVNSVFFRDHDSEVKDELEEFRQLNEAKLQEKLDAEKEKEKLAEETAKTGSDS